MRRRPRARCTTPRCPHLRPCPVHSRPRRRDTRARPTTSARGYGAAHQRDRADVLAGNPMCVWCAERPATTADHVPPLRAFADPSDWEGVLVPSCGPCQNRHIPDRDDWPTFGGTPE